MPGESFLPIVPLPLCRAEDEALQAAAHPVARASLPVDHGQDAHATIEHLVAMLNIEAERDAFLNTPITEREGSVYCGHIGALKQKIADWFDRKE